MTCCSNATNMPTTDSHLTEEDRFARPRPKVASSERTQGESIRGVSLVPDQTTSWRPIVAINHSPRGRTATTATNEATLRPASAAEKPDLRTRAVILKAHRREHQQPLEQQQKPKDEVESLKEKCQARRK